MNETAQYIAAQLKESERKPLAQIEQIVEIMGEEPALAYLDKTMEIESAGGMMTEKGERRRTAGGVYFYLVRGALTWSQRRKVFPYYNPDAPRGAAPRKKKQPVVPYDWEDRDQDFRRFRRADIGVARVEIKVVGKPLKVIEKPQLTVVTLRSGDPPSLPKGLPAPPTKPTVYLVLIAAKQWNKVSKYVKEPDNKLIVRGWPIYDKKLGTITVLAQSTTATLLEKEREEAEEISA